MRYLIGCMLLICSILVGCGQGEKQTNNTSLAEATAKQIIPQDEAIVHED